MSMNEKELKIISHLRKDARVSLASISQEVGMPISTVYDRIIRLHQNNIIKRQTILVDFSKLGYHHHVKLALKIEKSQKVELINFLKNNHSVNTIHEINNSFDLLIETYHQDIKTYIEFIDNLQECFDIIEMNEYQIIDEIQNEKFFLFKE